jgi:hypothetical protein
VVRVDNTPESAPDHQAAAGSEPSGDGPGAERDHVGAVGDGLDGDVDAGPDSEGDASDATDDGPDDDTFEGRDPLRFNRWMKRSATGAVMTGISLGLREALEQTKNEPALMIEASGQPDDPDHPIELHFDPDNPADTVAVIRQPRPRAVEPPETGDPPS